MTLLTLELVIIYTLFLVGLIGNLLPVIPGCFIIWLGIALDRFWIPEDSVSWRFFLIATALTILAQVLDMLCAYWGTKRFGGTWRGGLGAILGVIFFPIFLAPILGIGPIIGFIIGPIIGAILGELAGGHSFSKAGKAGFGSFVGGLGSFVAKFIISGIMIAGFFVSHYGLLG